MYVLSDKQMADCQRVLRLIRGHIDYCGKDGLRVYSSAAEVLYNLTNYLERLLNKAKFQQIPKQYKTGRSRKAKSSPSQTQDAASETTFLKKGRK